MLGLSGSSGRGKTTIVHLLLGFLTPDEGKILINDREADTAGRRSYWSRIAYVKQQPFLLHDTVLKNISLTDGGWDKDRMRQVIDATGLRQMGGSDAVLTKMITENGKNISGGQRQRIAFARALYKEADLLILDEPFSELDEAAERDMLDYCLQLTRQGKTILLITHNKKNLSLCHKTILLDEA
jgi:ABC-type transport system involved in cytochrome bd biosynthesis fused ATPase/permease subunit